MLSFDEWNVWYRTRRDAAIATQAGLAGRAAVPRGDLHDGDALAFGGACISLLNHADRVKSPASRNWSTSSRRS